MVYERETGFTINGNMIRIMIGINSIGKRIMELCSINNERESDMELLRCIAIFLINKKNGKEKNISNNPRL